MIVVVAMASVFPATSAVLLFRIWLLSPRPTSRGAIDICWKLRRGSQCWQNPVADNFDRNSRQRARNRRPGSGLRSSTTRGRSGNSFADARRQYERYIALADAAVLIGDPIEAQNYYQHAEHYFRVMHGVDAI
jgi:Domain of unknown function (DUF4167)